MACGGSGAEVQIVVDWRKSSMHSFDRYTKDYLFALLMSGSESEKYDALKELCKQYKDISYGAIVEFAKQHTK